MKSYHFRILRYVHDVSTEEFVNIGVMMWIPERSKLIFDANERFGRLSGFFKNFDGSGYRQMIHNLQRSFRAIDIDLQNPGLFKNTPETTSEIFNELVREDASCFQWSPLMSGISTNPEERFNQLFEEFVTFHEPLGAPQRRNETMIWKTVHQALKDRDLESRVQFDVKMETPDFHYSFKLGWHNGTRQVLEPISLTLRYPARIVDKAHTWSGRLFNLSKNNTFGCTAVLAPRDEYVDMTAFNQGFAILKDARSMREIITEDEVNDYISEIEKDLPIERL